MKRYCLGNSLALVAMAAALTACGGNGGGGGGGNGDGAAANDSMGKYVGTWQTACFTSTIFHDLTNAGAANHATTTLVVTQVSNTKLSFSRTYKVYASTDVQCAGPLLGTVTLTGENNRTLLISGSKVTSSYGENSVTYAGAASINGAPGADNVDLVTAPISDIANATYSMGNVQFSATSFAGGPGRSALYLNGSVLAVAKDVSPSAPYPTTLPGATDTTYTKQ